MVKLVSCDKDAWIVYPAHRKYFNKLWLSQKLGYLCGPAGIAPPKKDTYIVRPIYNLYGMGLGDMQLELGPDDCDALEPGTFWCEKFEGTHRSVNYGWQDNAVTNWGHEQKSCFIGEKSKNNPFVFKRWYRDINFQYTMPSALYDIFNSNVNYKIDRWNVEIIDDKVIEVHLRGSPYPDYDDIFPAYEGVALEIPEHRIKKYNFIKDEKNYSNISYRDKLQPKRLGFYVRNY